MPFADASFDRAIMLHVGMNIEDKAAVFSEVHRVLNPGGMFGVYDVTSSAPERIKYPTPWSSEPETSFVASRETYRSCLARAGFTLVAEHDRSELCKEIARQRAAAVAASGSPTLPGQPILMGAAVKVRQRNIIESLMSGVTAPVAFIAKVSD